MGLQYNVGPLHLTPAAHQLLACLYQINRALVFGAPILSNITLRFIHLYETTWNDQGIHGSIGISDANVRKRPFHKLLKISGWDCPPLLYKAREIRSYRRTKAGV